MKTKKKMLNLVMMTVLICATLLLGLPNAEASRVYIGIGTSYGPNVVYVPGHWYYGYWVPGQYVEYAGYPPGDGYVWYQGGVGYRGHWQHGYWGHGHHHHH